MSEGTTFVINKLSVRSDGTVSGTKITAEVAGRIFDFSNCITRVAMEHRAGSLPSATLVSLLTDVDCSVNPDFRIAVSGEYKRVSRIVLEDHSEIVFGKLRETSS